MIQRFIRDGRLDVAPLTEELRRFLDLTLREMHLELRYAISTAAPKSGESESPELVVDFSGLDQDLLLGRQGELLLALEYLAVRWLGLEPRFYDRIRLDSGDYRAMRLDELKLSARVAAQRVRETHQPFRFNPMPSRERRLIHLELTGAPGVRTESEGSGDQRHLVIYPTEKK
jgi:spoIIIJ-associated protein